MHMDQFSAKELVLSYHAARDKAAPGTKRMPPVTRILARTINIAECALSMIWLAR